MTTPTLSHVTWQVVPHPRDRNGFALEGPDGLQRHPIRGDVIYYANRPEAERAAAKVGG